MKSWLKEKDIPNAKGMCKPDLYQLVKINKSVHRTYKTDSPQTAQSYSLRFDVLRAVKMSVVVFTVNLEAMRSYLQDYMASQPRRSQSIQAYSFSTIAMSF
jgi:hypothetical protein